MTPFPWLLKIVEQEGPIQLIFSRNEEIISMCEFYDIDDAMLFIMCLDKNNRLVIKNPEYLKKLLQKSTYD